MPGHLHLLPPSSAVEKLTYPILQVRDWKRKELIHTKMCDIQRDYFDARDHYYVPNHDVNLPSRVDLRQDDDDRKLQIYDQLRTGSCAANAIAAALCYEEKAERRTGRWGNAGPSRLFIYWLGRGAYKDRNRDLLWPLDIGCTVREALRGLARCGVCSEQDWPFDVRKKNDKPSDEAFTNAKLHKIGRYYRLDLQRPNPYDKNLSTDQKDKLGATVLANLRHCLAEQHPVVFSFWFYLPISQSYDESQTPFMLKNVWTLEEIIFPRHTLIECLPTALRTKDRDGDIVAHGHAALAIGYDDEKQAVLIQNSRGPAWGGTGTFWMPYSWITDCGATTDFWTFRLDTKTGNQAPKRWEEVQKEILGTSQS